MKQDIWRTVSRDSVANALAIGELQINSVGIWRAASDSENSTATLPQCRNETRAYEAPSTGDPSVHRLSRGVKHAAAHATPDDPWQFAIFLNGSERKHGLLLGREKLLFGTLTARVAARL